MVLMRFATTFLFILTFQLSYAQETTKDRLDESKTALIYRTTVSVVYVNLILNESSNFSLGDNGLNFDKPFGSRDPNVASYYGQFNRAIIGFGFEPNFGLTGFKFSTGVAISESKKVSFLTPTQNAQTEVSFNDSAWVLSVGYKYWRVYGDFSLNLMSAGDAWIKSDIYDKIEKKFGSTSELDLGFHLSRGLSIEGFYKLSKYYLERKDSRINLDLSFNDSSTGLRFRFATY